MGIAFKLQKEMRRVAVTFCLAAPMLPAPLSAGPAATGFASEWTQIANNAQLGVLSTQAASAYAQDAQALMAQLEELRTQIAQYEIMIRNLTGFADLEIAKSLLGDLRAIGVEAQSLAFSAADLDRFLKSGVISDPLFEASGLSDLNLDKRFDEWSAAWRNSAEAALKSAGLALEDVAKDGDALNKLTARMGSEKGQLQALQLGNALSASLSDQLLDLRALTAQQNEQVTLAWGRVLADMDEEEAEERAIREQVKNERIQLENQPNGKTIGQIFGVSR